MKRMLVSLVVCSILTIQSVPVIASGLNKPINEYSEVHEVSIDEPQEDYFCSPIKPYHIEPEDPVFI